MTDNNIDSSRVREINGSSKREWVATGVNMPAEILAGLDEIAQRIDVPRGAVIIHACERLLATGAVAE